MTDSTAEPQTLDATPGKPTQVAHPGRATARTVASYAVAVLTFLLAAIPILQEVLGPLTGETVTAWLATGLTWVGAAHAIVTRLMALPGLQGILEKVRLGTGVEKERLAAAEHDATPPPPGYTPRYRADTLED